VVSMTEQQLKNYLHSQSKALDTIFSSEGARKSRIKKVLQHLQDEFGNGYIKVEYVERDKKDWEGGFEYPE